MKYIVSLALITALSVAMAACSGSPENTDEAIGHDAITDTVDAATPGDADDDVRPDAISETGADEGGPDAIHPDAQDDTADDVADDTVDDTPADGQAPDADATEPSCAGAVTLTAGTAYHADGLGSSTASVWQDYSCDNENSYVGPERIFSYTSDCDADVRLTVTPAGDPLTDSYLMVTVAILSSCGQDGCIDILPPAHPIVLDSRMTAGQTVYLAVEAVDTELPAFTIVVEQICEDCRDDDADGFDGFNEIYCPDGNDCNDDDADINPGKAETVCDGVDQDCSGNDSCSSIVCIDNDSDGYQNFDAVSCPFGLDCNDSNDGIHPTAVEVDCNGIDEDCDGIDWCPGSGQQCDSCLLTGACRDDHVCMPGLGGAIGVYAYCAKLCEFASQCPQGSTCVDDVYEGSGVCLADNSGQCGSGFLTVEDSCGNSVYSAQCPGDCDQDAIVCVESCPTPIPASVGTTIAGRLKAGTSTINSYPGLYDAAGAEAVYSFFAECDGAARATVTEMADLELTFFVLEGTCVNTSVVASDTGSSYVHETEFAITGGVTYYIAVDSSVQDDEGPFSLLVDVDCFTTTLTHCDPCQFDLQCESGYCHVPGEPAVTTGVCVDDCAGDGVCPDDSGCVAAGDRFVCLPDGVGMCEGQTLSITDACGLSYVLETCAAGTDCNAGLLECTNDCVDSDGDGYKAYNLQLCPLGNDCNDGDATMHPGAPDIRCNAIDEDCGGVDNCSDNGQCEECEGGHCADGYYCFVDPNFNVPGICLANCTNSMECPTGDTWDLSCWSWMSGQGDDSYYCRPQVARVCEGGAEVVTDGCGRTVQTNDCDINCYADFGCVNYCTAGTDHPGCGLTVHGTTVGGTDRTDYYYNNGDTRDDLTGPEQAYQFTASCTGEMNAVLTNATNWLTLVVVKNSGGTCMSNAMVAYDVFLDDPEVVAFDAIQGETYTLIVDGMDGAAGEFDLTVNCLCGAGCVDADADGFIDFDGAACPSGNDCDGTNDAIHPGAAEIECDDIDEDCSGYDRCLSHACAVDVELGTLSTAISGMAGQTTGETDEMTFYGGDCESPYARFNVETVYHFAPACTGTLSLEVSDALTDQFDIYLLEGACRADLCTDAAWYGLSTEVTADTDYYIVIDGNSSSTTNTWKIDVSVDCAS